LVGSTGEKTNSKKTWELNEVRVHCVAHVRGAADVAGLRTGVSLQSMRRSHCSLGVFYDAYYPTTRQFGTRLGYPHLLAPLLPETRTRRRRDFSRRFLDSSHQTNRSDGEIPRLSSSLTRQPGECIEVRSSSYWGEEDAVEVLVPPGHVFLQGDNLHFSKDSRKYGPVPVALIHLVAVAVIWPPWDWKRL
jgi:hypothetical protein